MRHTIWGWVPSSQGCLGSWWCRRHWEQLPQPALTQKNAQINMFSIRFFLCSVPYTTSSVRASVRVMKTCPGTTALRTTNSCAQRDPSCRGKGQRNHNPPNPCRNSSITMMQRTAIRPPEHIHELNIPLQLLSSCVPKPQIHGMGSQEGFLLDQGECYWRKRHQGHTTHWGHA